MKENIYNIEDKFKSEKLEIDIDTPKGNINLTTKNDINNNSNEEALIISNKETKIENGN